MTYYEILQIRNDASPEIIRAAYKSLIQKFHPDKHPDDLAADHMAKMLTEAYETLSDARRRAAYDESLKQPQTRGYSAQRETMVPSVPTATRTMEFGSHKSAPVVIVAVAVIIIIMVITATLYRASDRRSNIDATPSFTPALQSDNGRNERESELVKLFDDKLVLVLPNTDREARTLLVVVPEVEVRIAPTRLDEFKDYIAAHRHQIARDFAKDVPKYIAGLDLDSKDTGLSRLNYAMRKSFNAHHPDPVQNLCPPEVVIPPEGCAGVILVFLPKSYWVTSAKD